MAEPILYNTLNSAFDVAHSVIGVNGIEAGSPSYVPAKFNNGLDSDVNGKYADFAQIWPNTTGAVEIWFKPNADFGSMGNSEIIGYKTAADRWSLDINAGNLRVIYPTGGSVAVISSGAPSWTAGDLVHFRIVFNNNGLEGGSDTVRCYLNTVDIMSTTNSLDNETNEIRLGGQPSGALHANGVIDNFKVWDYANLDFAGIENERDGLSDQAISI